jgi:hypothetical protein
MHVRLQQDTNALAKSCVMQNNFRALAETSLARLQKRASFCDYRTHILITSRSLGVWLG